MLHAKKILAACIFLCLIATNLPAQSIYATLTGVISDQSEALITEATVKLRDEKSGSLRETKSNSQGYFTFASVPVGTYELSVEAQGFGIYKETGVALGGGERRNINVTLKVGSTTESVLVQGTPELLVPVDSGEKSTTLNVKQLQNFVQVGSNAAEFIKIMPGFGVQNGITNAANFSGQTIGINANGNAGSQSPLNNAYCVQRAAGQHTRHHGGRGACFRPRLQLRHAGESQLRHDRRVQDHDVELQRRKPEGSGGDQFSGQVRRYGLSRVRVHVRQGLSSERQ